MTIGHTLLFIKEIDGENLENRKSIKKMKLKMIEIM